MTSAARQPRKRKIWIVLPAFNEEKDLGHLLERVQDALGELGLPFEVVIVDDGSTDGTLQVVEQWAKLLPIRAVQHETNQGLGATIRDGLREACYIADAKDVIVTLDADNSHTPELILSLVRSVREGHDVVIASRFRPGSRVRGVPFGRRLLSRAAGIALKITFPIQGVRDYTCGYRAYRAEVLQQVTQDHPDFFDQDGFQVMVDILLKLRRNKNLIFGEEPLILRYDQKSGSSKMNVAATAADTLRLVIRRRFG
jgi:dolichol-phosphate mannosyltransferase